MTPVPLDLPLRPSEAAELARLVFEVAEGKALNDDTRNRVAARAARLTLSTIRPWFGSLARDPVHTSSYYVAVDAGDTAAPLLLHMAPASAPTTAVFPKPLLIGRVADHVINAIPFGPDDRAQLDAFASRIDPAVQPRPAGARSALVLDPTPAAFDTFRAIFKRTGKNLAATEGSYHRALWCAIRAGWREGWSAGVALDPATARETVRDGPAYTRFTAPAADLDAAVALHGLIRTLRSRPFDFELSFENASDATTAEELTAAIESMKARGHAVQIVAPKLAPSSDVAALAAVAQSQQCVLAISAPWPPVSARIHYKVRAHTVDPDSIASVLA